MGGPLEGIRVADFGRAAVGPLAATYLGMMGADVIKVEPPEGDLVRAGQPTQNGIGTTFLGVNITKRGIVLDLKNPTDLEIGLKLASSVDVIIDNLRSPEVMIRLGLGYKAVSSINPRIIYLQSSAYGNRGPMVGMMSGEPYAQASGGYTSVNGVLGGPQEGVRGTASFGPNGAMVNCQGILACLYVREKTGRGMYVETSQFQSSVMAGITRHAEYFATGVAPGPMGSQRPNIVPDQVFVTSDGFLAVSVPHNGFWSKFCHAIDRRDLLSDPRFNTNRERVLNREPLINILEEVFRSKTCADWIRVLHEHDVPCGEFSDGKPLSHILLEHPQVKANRMIQTIDTPWGSMNTASPHWRFSKNPSAISRPPPTLDQHREEILRELGN